MEILSHLLGTCGESHPNLITISLIVALFYAGTRKISAYLNVQGKAQE